MAESAELIHTDDACNLTKRDSKYKVNLKSMKGGKKYLTHSEVTVYTDESKMTEGTGSGYVIYLRKQRTRVFNCKLSENATVFQAEIFAIYKAVKYLISLRHEKEFKYVKILTDSQAALQALDNPHIRSRLVMDTVTELNELCGSININIAWIPAHVGHEGNEAADIQAKEGAQKHSIDHYIHQPKARTNEIISQIMIDTWNRRWTEDPQYRHTKFFFPSVDISKSKHTLMLSKAYLQIIVRAITGHNFLAKHQNTIGLPIATECRLCEEEPETFIHLCTTCPVLKQVREDIFCLLYTSPSPRDS